MFRPAVVLILSVLMAAGQTAQADAQAVGKFNDWRVYTEKVGRELVCFASTTAVDLAPKDTNHGEVTFFISSWKSGSATNQPSMKTGYDMRTDLSPKALVGGESFRMFAAGNEAFVADGADSRLVAAVRKGTELRIEAVSARDTRTAYHFSLKGSSDAIDRARKLCK